MKLINLDAKEKEIVAGGECDLLGGTFNTTYSDIWPEGYGPCSPGCESKYECNPRPIGLDLPPAIKKTYLIKIVMALGFVIGPILFCISIVIVPKVKKGISLIKLKKE